jgi:hypothetical protein
MAIASQITSRAASPSSHAPPSPVLTDAAVRWAAHRARYSAIYMSWSAESVFIAHNLAMETCTRALTGCPARLGSRSEARRRRRASGERVVVALGAGAQVAAALGC